MKAKTFVKNEARKDERAGIGKERNGNEREVGEHNDDEDFKVSFVAIRPRKTSTAT